eukprot:5041843-Amphidinium_carterae.1
MRPTTTSVFMKGMRAQVWHHLVQSCVGILMCLGNTFESSGQGHSLDTRSGSRTKNLRRGGGSTMENCAVFAMHLSVICTVDGLPNLIVRIDLTT